MNLDELTAAIEKVSPELEVQHLVGHLRLWKTDSSNVTDLASLVEHYLGNSWLSTDAVHTVVYSLWASFRTQAIDGIGGMTMNERLYFFGLFEEFENANQNGIEKIYAKLNAKL